MPLCNGGVHDRMSRSTLKVKRVARDEGPGTDSADAIRDRKEAKRG